MVNKTLLDLARQSAAALRLLVVATIALGVIYPLAVGLVALPLGDRAAGQPIELEGKVVGSALLGQQFEGDDWFHGRPSANDYDTLASAPTNLGPSSPDLLKAIEDRRAAVASTEGVDPAAVPADALTASASGLDPHISPAYAALQVQRVAQARGLQVSDVEALVSDATDGRWLGIHGEPAVNVVRLNLALAERVSDDVGEAESGD